MAILAGMTAVPADLLPIYFHLPPKIRQ